MNRIPRWSLPAALVLLLPPPAAAQEAPPMFWVYQEHVKPSMVEQYEAATKEMIAAFEAADLEPGSVAFTGITSLELGHVYAIPIEGFAGMDAAMDGWRTAIQAIGQEMFDELDARSQAAVDYAESMVIALRSDLSYKPETVALDAESPYRKYYWWYVTPGMQQEFEAAAKEFVSLYESHGIESGWRIYQGLIGAELPMYLVVERAGSAYDYEARDKELMDVLGDEAEGLAAKALQTARRVDVSSGWVRADLSFPPMESGSKE